MAPQHPVPALLSSLLLFPLAIWLGVFLTLWTKLRPYVAPSWPSSPDAIRRRVLLTGDNEQAVLSTARALHASGSTIYVVKHERIPYINFLRSSNAVHRYVGLASGRLTPILRRLRNRVCELSIKLSIRGDFALPMNLPGTILQLIETENVDTWIHCDDSKPSLAHMQAVDIALKHSTVRVLRADSDLTEVAQNHSAFSRFLKQADTGVRCPQTTIVHSRAEIHELLWKAPKGQKFLLERRTAPFSDAIKANTSTKRDSAFDDEATLVQDSTSDTDFEDAETSTPLQNFTLLPQRTPNETYSVVAGIHISKETPWLMHELIEGKPGTISALVARGKITAFCARIAPTEHTVSAATIRPLPDRAPKKHPKFSEQLEKQNIQFHHLFTVIQPTSTIGTALLHYAQRFATSLPEKPTTSLNLHFLLTDRTIVAGAEQRIVATGVDFTFSPTLIEQARADGQVFEVGRLLCGGEAVTQNHVLALPVADARSEQTGQQSPSRFENAIVKLLPLLRKRGVEMDADDLLPTVWYWLVQRPIEVVYEEFVEFLETGPRAAW